MVLPKKYAPFLEEELALVQTIYSEVAGYITVGNTAQRTYLSSEKISKLKEMDFDRLIVMDKLKPAQYVNLTRELKREVLDRIFVILEIFATHAGSQEALLQIELARLKHMLPLIKEGIRYAKIGELHGFLGAGKYGYEKYYLMLKRKEARVRRELERLREIRSIRRKARLEAGLPHVAIVGYTCAGKTSLFNSITGLSKPVGPEPFTTLTPKAQRAGYKGISFIVIDTVGFIRDIPPEIVESFYATLEEIAEADIIVNVVDASRSLSEVISELETCRDILGKIGSRDRTVVYALNKIDKINSYEEVVKAVAERLAVGNDVIPTSSTKRINIDLLLERIYTKLKSRG
ncbi:MAG: GTPase HflX [Desulfurococcaceae archaeon]